MFALVRKLFKHLDKITRKSNLALSLEDGVIFGLSGGFLFGATVGFGFALVASSSLGPTLAIKYGLGYGPLFGFAFGMNLTSGFRNNLGFILGFVPIWSFFIFLGYSLFIFGVIPVLGIILVVEILSQIWPILLFPERV